MAQIDDAADLLERAGLNALEVLFAGRGDGYADWCHNIASLKGRDAARGAIGYAVAQRAAANPWPQWWADTVEPMLRALPDRASLAGLRERLVEDFTAHMTPAGMDRFTAAGMAATWWEDSVHELQTSVSRGWKAVIEAWLTTAEASQDDKNAPDLTDQTAIKLLAGPHLASRAELAAAVVSLEAELKAAEATRDEDNEPRRPRPQPGRDHEDEIGAHQGQEDSQGHRRFTARHGPPNPRRHGSSRRARQGHRRTPQPCREARS